MRMTRLVAPAAAWIALCAVTGAGHAHITAEGLFLRVDGSLVVRVVGNTVTGSLAMPDNLSTDDLDVTFLDENGAEFVAPDPATLQWSINAVIASVAQTGPWSLQLTGQNVGTTNLAIKILFVDHVDYTSPSIPVRVVGASDVPVTVLAPGLVAWPNPCVDHLRYALTGTAAPSAGGGDQVRLLDTAGRLIWAAPVAGSDGTVPMAGLPLGSYWLEWHSPGTASVTTRVIHVR